jgi:hypothetical protein
LCASWAWLALQTVDVAACSGDDGGGGGGGGAAQLSHAFFLFCISHGPIATRMGSARAARKVYGSCVCGALLPACLVLWALFLDSEWRESAQRPCAGVTAY